MPSPAESFRIRRVLSICAVFTAGVSLAPRTLEAQSGCSFGEGSGSLNQITLSGGARIIYLGTPHFVCDDGVQIWADSTEVYSADNMAILMGNVRYLDRAREMRSETARYFTRIARLQARGSLVIRDLENGSRVENGSLVYLRATAQRPREELVVTAEDGEPRPRALLPGSGDPDTGEGAPQEVEGDRLTLVGHGYLEAVGDVRIVREALLAFADTAEFFQDADSLLLRGEARVDGDSYDLSARTIATGPSQEDVRELTAFPDAVLVGDDVELEAPRIVLSTVDGALQRLVAVSLGEGEGVAPDPDLLPTPPPVPVRTPGRVPPTRPTVKSEKFGMVADSLDVAAPDGVLERIFAVGRARSESTDRDSINVEMLPVLARSDWVEGDTIIAYFSRVSGPPDTVAPPLDSLPDVASAPEGDSSAYRLDRLEARGNASSLYRLDPADTSAVAGVDPPALHYVVGRTITIIMRDGDVEEMKVEGPSQGLHLEPGPRRADPPADTLKVVR
ncbi:MAG: hypothetical protein OEZ37_11680 [Gemmatimonadota bacterium]|nr:hypothetical protein [Gemmatimonadota bacterium]